MVYQVLYNTCYGGFTIPYDVIHRVFEEYPPHTERGQKLFETAKYTRFIEKDDEAPTDKRHFYTIIRREPFKGDYDKLILDEKMYSGDRSFYVQHRTTKTIYFFGTSSTIEYEWRSDSYVIQCMKEMDYIGKKFGFSNIDIADVPDCCTFSIRDYDGMESVHIVFPYRRTVAELLQYIEDRDETKLSEVTRKLISKEMKLSDISHY